MSGPWSPTSEADTVARLQPPGAVIAQATDADGITVRVVRGGDSCGDRLELQEWTGDRWVVVEDDTSFADLYDDMGWLAAAQREVPIGDAKDVHTEHCCRLHGCKYGSWQGPCSVFDDGKPQSYPCRICSDLIDANWDMIVFANEMWGRGYAAGLSVVTVV